MKLRRAVHISLQHPNPFPLNACQNQFSKFTSSKSNQTSGITPPLIIKSCNLRNYVHGRLEVSNEEEENERLLMADSRQWSPHLWAHRVTTQRTNPKSLLLPSSQPFTAEHNNAGATLCIFTSFVRLRWHPSQARQLVWVAQHSTLSPLLLIF